MQIISPNEFNIININDILPNQNIEGNIFEKDYLYDLPIQFGGTLDSNSVAKAKDTEITFNIKTGAPMFEK